jgi:hypothetical protein
MCALPVRNEPQRVATLRLSNARAQRSAPAGTSACAKGRHGRRQQHRSNVGIAQGGKRPFLNVHRAPGTADSWRSHRTRDSGLSNRRRARSKPGQVPASNSALSARHSPRRTPHRRCRGHSSAARPAWQRRCRCSDGRFRSGLGQLAQEAVLVGVMAAPFFKLDECLRRAVDHGGSYLSAFFSRMSKMRTSIPLISAMSSR